MSAAHSSTTFAGQSPDVAIPQLLDEQGPRLHALAMRLCGNTADAEDLVQETFLQAYRRWETFEGRSSPSTWLFTIASRMCTRMRRKRAGQPQRIGSLEQMMPIGDTTLPTIGSRDDQLTRQVRAEAQQRVEQAIAELPEHFRMAVVLKDVVGFSINEVAQMLGIKPATVKTRVHRARMKIREALDQALPRRAEPAGPSPYSSQMCLDLLKAKQEALDRGVPLNINVVCDRCRAVFAELDLGRDLCASIARGDPLPESLRQRIEQQIADNPQRADPARAKTGQVPGTR